MTVPVFPSLAGLGWDVVRTSEWRTGLQESVSGKETQIAYWSSPRYRWELTFDLLRSAAGYAEFQTLLGFFDQMQGRGGRFLFADPDDCSVSGQAVGTGDGTTRVFQLVRTLGGATAPVLAPNAVSTVKLAGAVQASGWTASVYGSASPGALTFVSAPSVGAAVTADFTYYWPCRFDDDKLDLTKFMSQLWSGKSVTFKSLKN